MPAKIVTIPGVNDLATRYPEIAAQWHPTRNGGITPNQVIPGEPKKRWWRCSLGHEWEAATNNRTRRGSGCPVCANRKLLPGFNDLATQRPDVAAQWHPSRNGSVTPDQVIPGEVAKRWWRCSLGHEWEVATRYRTGPSGSGCPACVASRASQDGNDLATRYPGIAAQWHPTRNGSVTPDLVPAGEVAKRWWRCALDHEWEAATKGRTGQDKGCPTCANRKLLPGFNDLATRYPDVAAQWHPTRNGSVTPDQVFPGEVSKRWWQCSLGHEWEVAPNARTASASGCPYCTGRRALSGFNDLATRHPDVAAQWHPTRNGDITPDQVIPGEVAKRWWQCALGHEWQTATRFRTSAGSGCPVCVRGPS